MQRPSKKGHQSSSLSLKNPDLLLALLLGICSSAAYDCLGSYGGCKIDLLFAARALVLTILIYVLLFILRSILSHSHESLFPHGLVAPFVKQRYRAQHGLILMTLLFLLCWLPYLIMLFPGNIYMDTSYQLGMYEQFAESGDAKALNTHHPLFDMFVFGFVADTMSNITGNYRMGIFILTLMQAICSAFSFSLAIIYANRRWHCPKIVICSMVIFFALLPLLPILICSISKDSFFSWIYVLFLVSVIDIILSFRKDDRPDRRSLALLCASSGLMCCTKNFGIYVALGTLIALALCRSKCIKKTFRIVLPAILCAILASGFAFVLPKAFGVNGGGMQEALSVPFQQTALSLIRHGDEMSPDDKEIISRVIDIDTIEEDCTPQSADGVKGYSPKGSRADYLLYIKTWLKQGFLYPKDYLDALVSHEASLLTMTPIRQIFDSSWTTSTPALPEGYNTKPEFNVEASLGVREFYNWIIEIPILNVLFISFTYAFFIPLLLICSICRSARPRVFLPVIAATLITLAGVMLSPIPANHFEATRYLIPLVYTAPILIALSSLVLQEDRTHQR